ncbi:MAG TPA: lipopolysaccharide heptosyltransferase II [Nitrospira sp.]|nr:lipopolysaccharide heptosyltransferase II [Nitrospira sp.]
MDRRRILFIKPSSLGDIVHAMPTLSLLRRTYPSARFTWLVKQQWSGLVERIEGVDTVCSLASGLGGWLSSLPALRSQQFDVAVDLQGLFRSAAMGWLSGARERIGFANGREGSPWFYTKPVPVPPGELHAVDRYLLVASAMGAIPVDRPEFTFRIPPSDHDEVDRLLERHGVKSQSGWVAINVSARWATKRWPTASFAAVADRLQTQGFGPVVFIGSSGERADIAAVLASMRTGAVNLAGTTPVGFLPALLGQARVLLTNDSGPMHIAAAVGTPVVALFGPTSALRTGPYGSQHVVLTHKIPCSPCFSRTCHHTPHLACLADITPDEAYAAVVQLERRAIGMPS